MTDPQSCKKLKRKAYACFLLIYTVLFSIIFVFGYSSFFKNEKSFIWEIDGLRQHYPALVYLGKYFREALRSILSGSPSFPLYDFRMGLGDDVMAPLLTHSANIDAFHLLSILVPGAKAETLYNVIVVLRIYASGLTFALFAKNVIRSKSWAILISALTYAFCGWAIFTAVRHPHFMIAMIYLPLLVTGLDSILKDKKPHLFTLSIFLSALTGFYFLYMQTLFLFIYALLRVYGLHKGRYLKNVFTYAVKTIGYYLVGVMMASVVFVPLVVAQLNSSRSNHVNVPNLWYSGLNEYMELWNTSISGTESWSSFGMAAIALMAVVLLFVNKTKHKKTLILGFLILLTIRLVPFGNLVFNGFGYVSHRWTFLFAFLFALILAYMLPHMISGDQKSRIACIVLTFVYGITALTHYKNGTTFFLSGFIFLGLTTLCLFLPNKRLKIVSLSLVLTLNLITNARFTFQNRFHNITDSYMKNGEVKEIYGSPLNVSDYMETADVFYREEKPDVQPNAPILQNYYGISEYWSMMNPNYKVSMFELENRQQQPLFWNIRGLDNRTILNTLASVKYVLATGNKSGFIPYGYDEVYQSDKTKKSIYANRYALPLGYTYEKILSSHEFEELNVLNKQEALLQAVALPDGEEYVNTDVKALSFNTIPIPYNVLEYQGLTWENGVLSVKESRATLTLQFDGLANSETYVRIAGIDNEDLVETRLRFKGNHLTKTDRARFWRHTFYFNKHDYLTNLGYSEEPQNEVTLTFFEPGTYRLKDIQVFCYPMTDYSKQVEALREDVLENVEIKTNQVTGDIDLDKDKLLCLSIPYSKGWSAKVDGEEREILRANTTFMALPLTAGHHVIELNYFTPGLKVGMVLSMIGIGMFLGTRKIRKV